MKKIALFFSAVAMFAFASCDDKNNGGGLNLDDIVLDGFYVYGEATGSDKVLSVNAMAAGNNEAAEGKPVRAGMFEKYIYLEANKDFALIENSAGNKIYYGADLVEVNYGYDVNDENCKNFADNPNLKIQHGALIISENPTMMKVKESGLYHIVLDNNKLGDLGENGAQIIIQKADWGVRGAMNGWGFTAGTMVKNEDGSMTWTWENQDMSANGEFKFASANGWKINLDVDGTVKAEIGLGLTDGKLSNTGGNIKVEKAGLYKLTLTYAPKAGAVADAFSYSVELTKESDLPTEVYMTGNDFGAWTWGSEGIVSLQPVHGKAGHFWTVRYIKAANPVKFNTINVKDDWSKAFGGLTTNTGFTQDNDGNAVVPADGLYMVYVNLVDSKLTIEPAKIYGIGNAFGSWTEGAHPFTVAADGTVSISVVNTVDGSDADDQGGLRMYAAFSGAEAGTWWTREFIVKEGKIVYRGGGDDQKPWVAVNAGQTVTLDFNAGTGSIQ